MHKIALIGGGASAILFLAHLSQSDHAKNFSVDVYDRYGAFAKGIAYSTKEICHLLNVPAFNMSAFQNDPDHFAAWAKNHGYSETDFVPRKLYGVYLTSILEEAEKKITVQRIQRDVTKTESAQNGFSVYCGDDVFSYDEVILATGNCKPLSVGTIHDGGMRYYASPWMIDTSVKNYDHIALIGSGLSAVDAILSLKENGFNGNMTLVSRHGTTPEPHGTIIKGKAPWSFDETQLQDKSPVHLFSFIRKEIQKAEAENTSWRSVIDGLRPYTNALWNAWNEREQKHFMRHLYTIWGVHRHRMAKDIFDVVNTLDQSDQLQRQANRAVEIRTSENECEVVLDNEEILHCDAVINCMGYRYDEKRSFASSYKIGPANFGYLFETTAIPEIRKQSYDVAEALIKKAGENSPALALRS